VAKAKRKIPRRAADQSSHRFRRSDWVSLAEVGEYKTRAHSGLEPVDHGARILASLDVLEALRRGCRSLLQSVKDGKTRLTYFQLEFWQRPDRLTWVNALNPSQQLADFSDRSYPWKLCVCLTSSELDSLGAQGEVFLHRVDAVARGLWLESSKAKPSPKTGRRARSRQPDKQPARPKPPRSPRAHAESAPTPFGRSKAGHA
jgi:hypothetical protein